MTPIQILTHGFNVFVLLFCLVFIFRKLLKMALHYEGILNRNCFCGSCQDSKRELGKKAFLYAFFMLLILLLSTIYITILIYKHL